MDLTSHVLYGAGCATPESDEARGQPGFRGQGTADSGDCADSSADCKLIATAIARAALLGIEVRPLSGGAWLLRSARGADIGVVHGLPALVAAVVGFEAAHNDMRELVQRRGAT